LKKFLFLAFNGRDSLPRGASGKLGISNTILGDSPKKKKSSMETHAKKARQGRTVENKRTNKRQGRIIGFLCQKKKTKGP